MYWPKVFPSISNPGYIGTLQGKLCRSAKRRPPAEMKMWGTLAPLRYFWIATLGVVPTVPTSANTPSSSTSLRVCSIAFGGLKALTREIRLILRPFYAASVVDHLEIACHGVAVA